MQSACKLTSNYVYIIHVYTTAHAMSDPMGRRWEAIELEWYLSCYARLYVDFKRNRMLMKNRCGFREMTSTRAILLVVNLHSNHRPHNVLYSFTSIVVPAYCRPVRENAKKNAEEKNYRRLMQSTQPHASRPVQPPDCDRVAHYNFKLYGRTAALQGRLHTIVVYDI